MPISVFEYLTADQQELVRQGDYTFDDAAKITASIQRAISDKKVSSLIFPAGKYRITRTLGKTRLTLNNKPEQRNRWGLHIARSSLELIGEPGAELVYGSDVPALGTWEKPREVAADDNPPYPLLFISADYDTYDDLSNCGKDETPLAYSEINARTISDIRIRGLRLRGRDIRAHPKSGEKRLLPAQYDFAHAIDIRNASNVRIEKCMFTHIDSVAIFCWGPGGHKGICRSKVRRLVVCDCEFHAERRWPRKPISWAAYITGVFVPGCDDWAVTGNYFNHCDRCVNGGTSFDVSQLGLGGTDSNDAIPDYDGDEDSYLGALRENLRPSFVYFVRGGRNGIVSFNHMHNAFEHSVYVHHNNLSITNNVIRMDKDCLGGDIKTRGRGVSIVGNVIDGVNNGIFVGSHDERLGGNITVVGNAIRLRVLRGDSDKEWQGPNAGIQVVHNNKTLAMPNVTIQGNSVEWPNDVWLPTNMPAKFEKLRQEEHVGVHICAVPHPDNPIKYSNSTDQLCLGNVAINGNSFQNCSIGVLLKGDCYSNVQISGNVFMGKTCKTQDGKAFSDADPETYSSLFVLGICYSSEIKPTHNVVFSGNIARAFRAMVGHSLTAGSTAVTDADILFNDNRFWAIRRAYSGCNPPGRDAADFQFIMNSGGRIHDDSGYPLNRFWNDVPPPLPSLSVSGPDFIGPGTIAIDTDGQ